MQIYVRKSKRYINGILIECIDIANVSVDDEMRGQGIFTRFLERLINEYDFNIYIESIINPSVERIGTKLGFIRTGSIEDVNMYLLK
jgi:predicted acetyltransferase